MFRLKFVDLNSDVCAEIEHQFSIFGNVDVYNGYFEDVTEYDCLVSPANSFGMMDGGMDASIIHFFGDQLEQTVQEYILEFFSGEQPVGTSMIVPTIHKKHPFLAHTPTMRIPSNITGTQNVYYAMKAMLSSVNMHNKLQDKKIHTVLCPGLGTNIGEMEPSVAVSQMALAYRHFSTPPKSINTKFIFSRVEEIDQTSRRF